MTASNEKKMPKFSHRQLTNIRQMLVDCFNKTTMTDNNLMIWPSLPTSAHRHHTRAPSSTAPESPTQNYRSVRSSAPRSNPTAHGQHDILTMSAHQQKYNCKSSTHIFLWQLINLLLRKTAPKSEDTPMQITIRK